MERITLKKPLMKVTLDDAVKVLPHSVEAEQSLLGGLMIDHQVWDKIVSIVQEVDFYRFEHRLIFRVMVQLANSHKPLDVVTVMEALRSVNELDKAGSELYLFELAKNTPSVANVEAYAEIVREKSVLRQLINAASEIANDALSPKGQPVAEILDNAETKIFAIAEQTAAGKAGPQKISTLLARATERIDELFHNKKPITGLATGFYDFDKMTSGLQPSELVIVAGRPSMGKTTFVMNIAENAAINLRMPVLVFSLEMSGDSLAMRMLSSLGNINQQKLRTGQLGDPDWARITSTVDLLAEAPLFVDDAPSLSPGELRARARRAAKEHGQLGLIVIDYLQLMHAPGFKSENRVGEISEISRSLKILAKEVKAPVIALSQLNRGLEQRSDKRPIMSDLRESGAIEQDADLIAFIYRDEVYNEDSADKGKAEIIIAKQRNGPTGKVLLKFNGECTKFENLATRDYEQLMR